MNDNRARPRSQALSPLPSLSLREAKEREPGIEVEETLVMTSRCPFWCSQNVFSPLGKYVLYLCQRPLLFNWEH